MSFKVNLYTLSKRDNSTKRPNTTPAEYDCILKDGCSLFNPAIQLDLGLAQDPSQYNYAYIPAFGRYYFIEDWYFSDRLWTAHMAVDVLATYKTEIGDASLYVLRAYHDHDGRVIDNLYPMKTQCAFDSTVITHDWWSDLSYVVGTVSIGGNMGSLAYYGMDSGNINTMCANLMDYNYIVTAPNGFDPADLSGPLQLSLVDPIQYIKSCMALPVSLNDLANIGSAAVVYAYSWDSGATGYKIALAPYINKSFQFAIKKHPDTNSRGAFVNSSPYTLATLTMPPFGTIEIDTSVICKADNNDTLDAMVRLDPITGKAILTVSFKNTVLNRVEAQLGVPVSLSSVTRDYVGAASSVLGSVGGMVGSALAGNVGSFIGSAAGLGSAAHSMCPRATTVGTTGGFATGMGDFRLDFQFFRPVNDDPVHNGRPLCEVRQLKTLPGYMLIQDGDVTIAGTATEDSKIRNYLESGFYYE